MEDIHEIIGDLSLGGKYRCQRSFVESKSQL